MSAVERREVFSRVRFLTHICYIIPLPPTLIDANESQYPSCLASRLPPIPNPHSDSPNPRVAGKDGNEYRDACLGCLISFAGIDMSVVG